MSNQANLNNIPQSVLTPDSSNVTMPSEQVTNIPENVTKEPSKIEKEPSELTSTRWAHLSKKEAALVKERENFKKEMDAYKKEREETKMEYDKYKKSWEMVNEISELQKTNAVEAMRKAGFSETDAYNFLSQQEEVLTTEDRAAKAVQAELKKYQDIQDKKIEDEKRHAEELRVKNEEKTIAQFKNDIGSHLKSDMDKYEFCLFHGEQAQELIYDTVAAIIDDSNGEGIQDADSLLSEAALLVEGYYEELDKSMSSLKKRGFKAIEPTKEVKEPIKEVNQNEGILNKIRSSTRVEAKEFVDNKPPTKTLSNLSTQNVASSNPNYRTHEQNKQFLIDKYSQLLKK